jgi:hypothetical protein
MSAKKNGGDDEPKPATTKPAAFRLPDMPTIYNLEVVVMPNGEILCAGRSIGWASKVSQFLTEKKS